MSSLNCVALYQKRHELPVSAHFVFPWPLPLLDLVSTGLRLRWLLKAAVSEKRLTLWLHRLTLSSTERMALVETQAMTLP